MLSATLEWSLGRIRSLLGLCCSVVGVSPNVSLLLFCSAKSSTGIAQGTAFAFVDTSLTSATTRSAIIPSRQLDPRFGCEVVQLLQFTVAVNLFSPVENHRSNLIPASAPSQRVCATTFNRTPTMSSDSGLDDPNHQLEDTEIAPKGSDDGENGGMDDLFGDVDDEPIETAEAEPTVYGHLF